MGAVTKAEKLRREELAKNGLKVCSHCKRELEFSYFCNDKTQKDGLSNRCRECRSVDNRKYEQAHKEDRYLYKKQYREENRDRLLAYNTIYEQEHAENITIQQKLYRESHRSERIEATKRWRQNNPDKLMAYNQSARVKTMKKSYRNKRRALALNTGGSYTDEDVKALLEFFDNKCAYTGEPLEAHFHLDHIVPLIKGGTNYIWNLVPSNPTANLSKGKKVMETWFAKQKYFSEERLSKIHSWMLLGTVNATKEDYAYEQYGFETAS